MLAERPCNIATIGGPLPLQEVHIAIIDCYIGVELFWQLNWFLFVYWCISCSIVSVINLVQILVDTIFVDRSRSILLTIIYKCITAFLLFPMITDDTLEAMSGFDLSVMHNMKYSSMYKMASILYV